MQTIQIKVYDYKDIENNTDGVQAACIQTMKDFYQSDVHEYMYDLNESLKEFKKWVNSLDIDPNNFKQSFFKAYQYDESNDCFLTGVCYDAYLMEDINKYRLNKNNYFDSVKSMISYACLTALSTSEDEIKERNILENIIQDIHDSGYSFLKDGTLYEDEINEIKNIHSLDNFAMSDITNYLRTEKHKAFIMWGREDVEDLLHGREIKRNQIDVDQILANIEHSKDTNCGITWETLQFHIDDFFTDRAEKLRYDVVLEMQADNTGIDPIEYLDKPYKVVQQIIEAWQDNEQRDIVIYEGRPQKLNEALYITIFSL